MKKYLQFLTICAVLVFTAGNVWGQVTIVGDPYSGNPYATIQAAIDAASSGDVINLAAGTYDVGSTIIVNKEVTITGPGGGAAIVRNTAVPTILDKSTSVFEIAANNVTIEYLDITVASSTAYLGTLFNEEQSALIRVPNGSLLSGITIRYNNLYVPAQPGAMSTWGHLAITLGNDASVGADINNNNIYNTRNGVVTRNNNTATVSNNIIYDTKGGIMNYTNTQADADNRTMSNNSWTAAHNEWDIVWNTAYWVPDYQASVLAVSSNNNSGYVLDRRAADGPAAAALTGNRSHIFVNSASTIAAAHPARGNFNEPFKTIALGIAAVVPGGTVNVAEGIYSETLTINKAITLTGASETGVVINIPAVGGYGISVTSSDVVLENFTLETNNSNLNYPIHASGTSNPPNGFDNLTIQNVTIKGIHRRTGFDIHGYNNVVLSNLTSSDAWGGNGISLTGCINVTVQNCTTSDNAWGGIAVYVSNSTLLNRGSDNINIDLSNNSISEWLYVEDEFGLINTNIHIQNWTYVINNEYSAPTSNYFAYISGTINDAVLFGNGLNAKFSNKFSTIYDPSLTNWYVGPDLSIQAAINAAAPGDVINVAAGTYNENVDINKKLTLQGAGSGTDAIANTIIDPSGGLYGLFIHQPVNLKNLRVTGAPNHGIRVQSSTSGRLNFNDVIWENIASSFNGTQGVELHNNTDVTNMKITNCEFVGNTGSGIRSASNVTIDGMVITDCKFNQNSYGLYLQGTINNLNISGSSLDLNGAWGLYMSETGPIENVVIENSSFNGNVGWGIVMWTPLTINDISITGSSIDNNPATGYPNGKGVYIEGDLGTTNANATCNWWGAADGPSGSGGGSGDAVSDNVTFSPWLVTPAPCETCIGGTPLGNKMGVRDNLAALAPSGDKKTDDRIKKAIEHIDHSLDANLWEDGMHLTDKGKKVFDEEKKAVKELYDIAKEKKHDLLKTEAQEAIDGLVAVDHALAQTAIADAIATAGSKSKEIEKAVKEMDKAAEELAKGDYDHAIDKYKKAWEHALKAVKGLAKDGANVDSDLADSILPEEFSLAQNYPNPFNPVTTIQFSLPAEGNYNIVVYSMLGEAVTELANDYYSPGTYKVQFDGKDLPSGIYVYQLLGENIKITKKMILMK